MLPPSLAGARALHTCLPLFCNRIFPAVQSAQIQRLAHTNSSPYPSAALRLELLPGGSGSPLAYVRARRPAAGVAAPPRRAGTEYSTSSICSSSVLSSAVGSERWIGGTNPAGVGGAGGGAVAGRNIDRERRNLDRLARCGPDPVRKQAYLDAAGGYVRLAAILRLGPTDRAFGAATRAVLNLAQDGQQVWDELALTGIFAETCALLARGEGLRAQDRVNLLWTARYVAKGGRPAHMHVLLGSGAVPKVRRGSGCVPRRA